MNNTVLKINNLNAGAEGKTILHDLNLQINAGETHVLMGPNGAGKSTLGNVILGNPQYSVTKGSIFWENTDITTLRTDERAQKGMFMSFQNPLEIPGISISQFIRTALQASIDAKMAKVGTGHTDEIIVADANGDASASGVKAGGATFKGTPDAATLATEQGTTTYVQGYAVPKTDVVAAGAMATSVAAASDTKVTSEKAVVDALTWKTTV